MHPSGDPPATSLLQSGSTLVEVLVALSILAIGVAGLTSAQGRSLAMSQLTHEHLRAHSLALSVVELARASPEGSLQGPWLEEWRERASQSLPDGELSLQVRHGGSAGQVVVRWSGALGGSRGPQTQVRDFQRQ